ncbi:MAG: aminotransferase class V-fold PLP-dependent enzyme, partial [Flavobacteriales bacterium]
MDKGFDRIVDEIKEREEQGRELDIPEDRRQTWMDAVSTYANDFLDALEGRKAYESEGYDRTDEDSGFEVGEKGADMDGVLHFIGDRVDHTGLNPASGGHLGYIPGGGIPASALGDYLAATTNRYAGNFYASPGAVRMENAMIRWTGQLIGYKEGFGGNLTSGGSIANLIAILTARTAKGLKGKDLERNVVYMTPQGHHSLAKALNIACLGECVTRKIALDRHYRMDVAALRKQVEADVHDGLKPFLLIANAGSTDTGAIDPLSAMADTAKEHGMWFHVDAAYGGFFLLTDHGKKCMAGIDRSDSVVLDPHKGLFLPYGSGIVLVKHIHRLLQANSYEANYMQDAKEQTKEYSP